MTKQLINNKQLRNGFHLRGVRHFWISYWNSDLLSFVWEDLDGGGCCWIRNSIYLREDKAHGPNFVFSSIIQDRYSINYCFRFDKVSTSYRLFVTTFLDVAHDRDQNRSLPIPWLKILRPK